MTLYRKYRPQTFADFINQKSVKEVIQNQIAQGMISHAYLFSGPRGVGKTTMARLLSKALNCESRRAGTFEPCTQCVSCQEIQKGVSLDLIEQDAASNRGIEEIRNLRENVRFSPVRSSHKIFIIDEVHMLTAPAFNALLKTLEEPPSQTVFVLATTESYRLPETIVSRCQRFDFKKVREEEIAAALTRISKEEQIAVADDILQSIARRADGDVRDALTMLAQITALYQDTGGNEITAKDAEFVIPRSDRALADQFMAQLEAANVESAFTLIEEMVEEGVELSQFTEDLIRAVRQKMVTLVYQNKNAHYYRLVLDVLIPRLEEIKRTHFLPRLPLELAVLECAANAQRAPAMIEEERESASAQKPNQDKEDIQSVKEEEVKRQPVTFEVVKEQWAQVLAKSKEYNHTLPLALSLSFPLRLEEDRLILGFKYKLHYDTIIGNHKNRMLVERLMAEVFAAPCLIGGEVVSTSEEEPQEEHDNREDVIESVREVFGS